MQPSKEIKDAKQQLGLCKMMREAQTDDMSRDYNYWSSQLRKAHRYLNQLLRKDIKRNDL